MKQWICKFKNTDYGRLNLKSAVVALLSVLVLCVFIWVVSVFSDMLGIMPGKGCEVMVEIPKGTSVKGISQILKDENVIRHPFVFRMYVNICGSLQRFDPLSGSAKDEGKAEVFELFPLCRLFAPCGLSYLLRCDYKHLSRSPIFVFQLLNCREGYSGLT